MEFTRALKRGMSGDDVKYMQSCLVALKYNLGSSGADGKFGPKTEAIVKEYQSRYKDANSNKLTSDGIIGKKTWNAIVRDYEDTKVVKFTRDLKKGMGGADVRYMKDLLFYLGYYSDSIKKISSNTFGNDTVTAVKLYQSHNKDLTGKPLTVDGIIGKATWYAILRDYNEDNKKGERGLLDEYTHISKEKRKLIEKDLEGVSELRKEIVLEILKYAYDHETSPKVRALYIFGANLYNADLTLNIATNAGVEKSYKAHPSYFSDGRKEWMLDRIKEDPNMPASDCSGMEIGYMRKHKLIKATADATANSLCGNTYSTAITRAQLKPGDWVGKDGHIGTYVGGGFVVEFYGGAYGCQLTNVDNRVGYDFVNKVKKTGKPWTKFRRPKAY